MIQITCKGNSAICTRTERLTSGMVGLQCKFEFDSAWDGLARTAVFLAGNEKRDVMLTGAVCTVPWEVLKTAGYQLVIGVYGTNADGTLVIPTVYAMCGGIASGADPSGDESTDPTLPVWGQMQGMIGDLSQLQTSAKSNLVAAINEAAKSGGGGSGGASIELDTTLTQSGKAADAKAVGDALAEKQPKGDYLTRDNLQSATNAALEQAKASGEFDGIDGITPHIGDNGNWYLGDTDTGKPSRGDAGAGMDITGATVGQIAKITSVDDTGKPTAWAPADMPSGGSGEDMRVIKTITITADGVNSIYFNRDDNGLPFALTKHIRIRMYGAVTNTGSTQAVLFFRAGQTNGDISQSQYPIKVNSNNVNYIYDFVWDLYSSVNCWYGDFAYAHSGTISLQRYVPSESNNSSDITVREIKLVWSNASVFFQQGATIVVEGM